MKRDFENCSSIYHATGFGVIRRLAGENAEEPDETRDSW